MGGVTALGARGFRELRATSGGRVVAWVRGGGDASGRLAMGEREIRAALERHWAASDANDFETEHEIYREDAVLDYPQSGERISGRRNIQLSRALRSRTSKRFAVRRIIGAGNLWLTEYVLTYDGHAVLHGEHHGVPVMARWPVKRSISAIRSNLGARARNGSSRYPEGGSTMLLRRSSDAAFCAFGVTEDCPEPLALPLGAAVGYRLARPLSHRQSSGAGAA